MSFPYMNAVSHGHHNIGAVAGDSNNWFKAPGVVDVSGMEFTFALATTKAAASASVFTIQCTDGGTTGTAAGALFTAITNSPSSGTAWTDLTVRNQAGTSATDLDADDLVNLVTTTAGTAATGLSVATAYIVGKPGAIN